MSALSFILALVSAPIVLISADWNILNQKGKQSKHGVEINLKNYCESWRMNVELHNIRKFKVVPEECTNYIGKYVNSVQYRVDSERAIDECNMFLSTSCSLKRDGRDVCIFDVDDTLLSTVPYFKKHHSGGEMLILTSLEEWMSKARAPALDHTMKLFNDLKKRGVQFILVDTPFIPFGPNCTHECGQKKYANGLHHFQQNYLGSFHLADNIMKGTYF